MLDAIHQNVIHVNNSRLHRYVRSVLQRWRLRRAINATCLQRRQRETRNYSNFDTSRTATSSFNSAINAAAIRLRPVQYN